MPSRKTIQDSGIEVQLYDLGDPMNAQVFRMYLALAKRQPLQWEEFDRVSANVLTASPSYQIDDAYFNNLTPLWGWLLERGRYLQACDLWEERIAFAEQVEDGNPRGRVHKGTPYYFLGYTHIRHRDYHHGFLAMHKALDEDLKTHGAMTAATPAMAFVKLDFKRSDQFAAGWVEGLAKYVDNKLATYRAEWNGALTIDDLRTRFLQLDEFTEPAFSFVHQVSLAREAEVSFDRKLIHSNFGEMTLGTQLFQIALVTDETIGSRHTNPKEWHYFERLLYLSSKVAGTLGLRAMLEDVSRATQPPNPVSPVLQAILDGAFPFRTKGQPNSIQKDFLVSYLLRNRGAHSLESQGPLTVSYPEVLQRSLNPLFGAVEALL